jgi:hypothetical protein
MKTKLGVFFSADSSIQFTAGQANRNIIAHVHLVSGAQNFSRSIINNRVAALKNPEWAALLEPQPRFLEPVAFHNECAIECCA